MNERGLLAKEELEHAHELLDAGRALPAYWYSAKHVFEAERRQLFRSSWLYFGRTEQLPEPNTYAADTVATMPILVTRDQAGELHGFFNTCRHRMHEVATGCGTAKVLSCNYHGWCYKLTGELAGVPRSAEIYAGDAEGFDKEQFGLRPVQVAVWYGMVFVNADLDASAFSETYGELTAFAQNEPLPEGVVMRHRDVQLIDANWKTLVDNVIECYHCATIHPELAATVDVSAKATIVTHFACGSALQNPLRGDHTPEERRRGSFHAYFLPPHAWLSCKGDRSALIVVVDPVTEHRSRLTTVMLAPADAGDDEIGEMIASAELVNQQDRAAALSSQRGYDLDPDFNAYQLPESERTLRVFARSVLSSLGR